MNWARYGKELILDVHHCTYSFKRNMRKELTRFCIGLCLLIDMQREDLHFWDFEDQTEYDSQPDHLQGTSLVQFIKTSNITIHTLDRMKRVYVNLFSCKDFDEKEVEEFVLNFFGGQTVNKTIIERH